MPRLRISQRFFGCRRGSERDGGIGKDILGDMKQKKKQKNGWLLFLLIWLGLAHANAGSGLKSSANRDETL